MKLKAIKPDPDLLTKPGDFKITHHFAWLPVSTDKEIIWLEHYKRIYEYTYRERGYCIGTAYIRIKNCGWDLRQVKRFK